MSPILDMYEAGIDKMDEVVMTYELGRIYTHSYTHIHTHTYTYCCNTHPIPIFLTFNTNTYTCWAELHGF